MMIQHFSKFLGSLLYSLSIGLAVLASAALPDPLPELAMQRAAARPASPLQYVRPRLHWFNYRGGLAWSIPEKFFTYPSTRDKE